MSTPMTRLAKFTAPICNRCPIPADEKDRHRKYRCCDRLFCTLVRDSLPKDAPAYRWDENAEVPYLENGKCRVSPEHRPFCTAYICPGNLGTKGLLSTKEQKAYRSLCHRANVSPVNPPPSPKA